MPQERKVAVIMISQVTRLSPRGDALPFMRVEYRVGEEGPFAIEVPKSEFTAASVREKLEQEASAIRALLD